MIKELINVKGFIIKVVVRGCFSAIILESRFRAFA